MTRKKRPKLLHWHINTFVLMLRFRDLKDSFEHDSLVLEFLECQGILRCVFSPGKLCEDFKRK